MKIVTTLVYTYFIFISVTSAQYPDTILINTEKVKGFGPFPLVLDFVGKITNDNPWITTTPSYKGIPDSLNHLMFTTVETDFLQHTYQNYISGKITRERFNELKKLGIGIQMNQNIPKNL
mgnify:CR=1 FL=1